MGDDLQGTASPLTGARWTDRRGIVSASDPARATDTARVDAPSDQTKAYRSTPRQPYSGPPRRMRQSPVTADGVGARHADVTPLTGPRMLSEREWPRVERLLTALRQRMGAEYGKARLGRIDGSDLHVEGHTVRLLMSHDREHSAGTVGTTLGAGVFYLNPVPRKHAGLVALTEGGVYAVSRVAQDGEREDTGVRVVTWGLASIPAGVLAYVPSNVIWLQQTTIVGRPPPDIKAIAAAVAADLDRHHKAWAPASVTSMVVLARMRGLDHDELMKLLSELGDLGKLGQMLTLVRASEFRNFLRDRQVPWTYVFANWEPNIQDAAAFFAGVLIGGGENAYDMLKFVADLVGVLFSDELVKKAREFWLGVVRLANHPLLFMDAGMRALRDAIVEGMPALRDAFLERLFRLEFFDAGRILGNAVVTLMTLASAIKSLPKLAASVTRLTVSFTKVSVGVAERFGLRLVDLARAAAARIPTVMITDTGHVLAVKGPNILVMAAKDRPTLAVSRAEVLLAAERDLRGVRLTERAPESPATGKPPAKSPRRRGALDRKRPPVESLESSTQSKLDALDKRLTQIQKEAEFLRALHSRMKPGGKVDLSLLSPQEQAFLEQIVDDPAKLTLRELDDLPRKLGHELVVEAEKQLPLIKQLYREGQPLHKILRKNSPSFAARAKVIREAYGRDAATGLPPRSGRGLAVDHVVPLNEIVRMKGFSKLPLELQLEIVNDTRNLRAIDALANSARGDRSWSAWPNAARHYDPAALARMRALEGELRGYLEGQIAKLSRP